MINKQKLENIVKKIENEELINIKNRKKYLDKLWSGNCFIYFQKTVNIIFFTTGGFTDNCYGIAYSKTDLIPKYCECGKIIRWKKLNSKWFIWSST